MVWVIIDALRTATARLSSIIILNYEPTIHHPQRDVVVLQRSDEPEKHTELPSNELRMFSLDLLKARSWSRVAQGKECMREINITWSI